MNIEYMKNLIYTFVGSMALVLLTGCSAEFENGTPCLLYTSPSPRD